MTCDFFLVRLYIGLYKSLAASRWPAQEPSVEEDKAVAADIISRLGDVDSTQLTGPTGSAAAAVQQDQLLLLSAHAAVAAPATAGLLPHSTGFVVAPLGFGQEAAAGAGMAGSSCSGLGPTGQLCTQDGTHLQSSTLGLGSFGYQRHQALPLPQALFQQQQQQQASRPQQMQGLSTSTTLSGQHLAQHNSLAAAAAAAAAGQAQHGARPEQQAAGRSMAGTAAAEWLSDDSGFESFSSLLNDLISGGEPLVAGLGPGPADAAGPQPLDWSSMASIPTSSSYPSEQTHTCPPAAAAAGTAGLCFGTSGCTPCSGLGAAASSSSVLRGLGGQVTGQKRPWHGAAQEPGPVLYGQHLADGLLQGQCQGSWLGQVRPDMPVAANVFAANAASNVFRGPNDPMQLQGSSSDQGETASQQPPAQQPASHSATPVQQVAAQPVARIAAADVLIGLQQQVDVLQQQQVVLVQEVKDLRLLVQQLSTR